LNLAIPKKCIAFLFSDFLGPTFDKALRAANRRHDLVATPIEDRLENQMPSAGIVVWEDSETGLQVEMDTSLPSVREAIAHEAEQRHSARRRLFLSAAVDFIEIYSDQPYEAPLVSFFRRRALKMRR